MIYFDSAATTLQKPKSVAAAAAKAIASMTTPGRGDYAASRQAADTMLQLRTKAASFFGVDNAERVVLTMNATHGLNVAIKSLVSPGARVVISGYEHNAVTRPLHALGAETVIVNGELFRPEQMAEGFERSVTENTAAVVCNHVSNVFGYTLPVDDIADICRKRGVPLIVDASQSAGILPVDVGRWDAAFAACPGHKGLYGPQGTGLLLCGRDVRTVPLLEGGTGSLSRQQDMPESLPDRLEAGTQNVHGAAGLLEGLNFVESFMPGDISRYEGSLMRALAEGLKKTGRFRVLDDPGGQGSVLSVVPVGQDVGVLADYLAEKGVAVRAGLHCAPLAHQSGGTLGTGTIRFSASVFNTISEVEQVLALLK